MIEHITPHNDLVKPRLDDFQARKNQFANGQMDGICQDHPGFPADIFQLKPAKGDQLQSLNQRSRDRSNVRPRIKQC